LGLKLSLESQELATTVKRFNLGLVAVLGVAFVVWGDRIFPGRIGEVSSQARSAIVSSIKNSFPSDTPGENPNERTKKAIDDLEQR